MFVWISAFASLISVNQVINLIQGVGKSHLVRALVIAKRNHVT